MRILVCPLDWGLGHAGRCIPLIRAFLDAGHEVRIAAAGGALRLLRGEFPELAWDELPGYRVRYARSAAMLLPALALQAPAILAGWRAEKRGLARLLAAHPCDLVISDGRYGLRAPAIPTLFITHQIAFRLPRGLPGRSVAERLLLALNLKALAGFERVWIPDWPPPRSLAGTLAGPDSPPGNREWIGPLGRFSPPPERSAHEGPRIDIGAVVSGPEPQRTLFEARLRAALADLPGTRVLVRGLPGASGAPYAGLASIRAGELNVFDHLPGGELARVFADADVLVARSGYTTVMELAGLGTAAAVLAPTPGQTEQEYLADYLASFGAAVRWEQDAPDLAVAISKARDLPGFRSWREDDCVGRLARFIRSHPTLARSAALAVGKRDEQ
jgi:hypothetical protein